MTTKLTPKESSIAVKVIDAYLQNEVTGLDFLHESETTRDVVRLRRKLEPAFEKTVSLGSRAFAYLRGAAQDWKSADDPALRVAAEAVLRAHPGKTRGRLIIPPEAGDAMARELKRVSEKRLADGPKGKARSEAIAIARAAEKLEDAF